MNYRKATLEDITQLAHLFDLYRQFYRKPSDIEAGKQFLTERLVAEDSELFVAIDNEQNLTGFVQLYPLFSSTRMKRLWLLNDLFVHPNFRGQGISIGLINQAKELVKTTNACGMYLETEISNQIGNNLYPRAGFTLNEYANFYEWNIENP